MPVYGLEQLQCPLIELHIPLFKHASLELHTSQLVPTHPGAHIQVTFPLANTHVAPFRQGFKLDVQIFWAFIKKNDYNILFKINFITWSLALC